MNDLLAFTFTMTNVQLTETIAISTEVLSYREEARIGNEDGGVYDFLFRCDNKRYTWPHLAFSLHCSGLA
jgi:hypothetical protein